MGTGLFIMLIARKVDLSTVIPIFRQCRWEWFLVSLLLLYVAAGLTAIRWRMLWPLPGLGLHKYLYFVFLGYFFNAFLPSAAFSEAMRVLAFGRKYGHIHENIGVNLLAKVMGGFAQILVAGGTALFFFSEWKDLRLPLKVQWDSGAWVMAALLGMAVVALLIFKPQWRDWRWTQAILVVLRNRSIVLRTFGIGLLLQLVLISATYTLYFSMYPETRFWHVASFMLLIQLALLVPLTAGGVGMREYLSLVFFSDIAGMPADVVLGVSLLGYIPFLLMAFTGGGWMLFRQLRNAGKEDNMMEAKHLNPNAETRQIHE